MDHFSGVHSWYARCHTKLTYCNVCREAVSGVTSIGLSCEVCKFKAHKHCAVHVTSNCKWTTLASIGKDVIEDEEGISMPHQWLEGNLPIHAKCTVCDKTCGSVLRLQDWRCLWCKAMVHTRCKEQLSSKCPLGRYKVSIIPPTALNSIDSDGFWEASCHPSCTSPLLVFVNFKSGNNHGVKFLRRFKQLMNPAQVFDLGNGGPHLGLRLFQKLDKFGILVCGGDGSVRWVLSEIDTLTLHKQCQVGVLPLGTGNDLARVLGWGSVCDDYKQVPQILERLEGASVTMLDRWSIMVYETNFSQQHSASMLTEDCSTENMECYTEKLPMNIYFGIGLDAKIYVEFNNKREEHPEKCRSRAKNKMWYGVLAISELLQRTYTNLEQRVLLECDGRPITLPSLQGIVVLNISSYAGGANFWGGTKRNDTFAAPSFDDKVLEVVAVFGVMQLVVSRVINLQHHHRIAQCRTVKITILGDESVPVHVDGEGWLQPPGFIQIIHKNQTQTLSRG